MATPLIECNRYTLEGIRKMKMCTQQTSGVPINFPTDFILYNNDDSTIQVSEDILNQTFTIGNQTMDYLEVVSFDMATFSDERRETRQGVWFEKRIEIVLPRVQLYATNQLFDFLFNVDGTYALAQCVFAIEDTLGQNFLIGYDVPAILQSMELQTDEYGSTNNQYKMEFSSKSYSRLRRYVVI